jgi:hypothetical protein
MRLCSCAHSSLGLVVMMAKVRIHSSVGERQFSQRPASAIRLLSASPIAWGCLPVSVFAHSQKLSTGTRQRRRLNASRNAGLVSIPPALALILAKPTLRSLDQHETGPSATDPGCARRSCVEADDRKRVGRRDIPARREVRPMRRDREHQLDLADIGGETSAATHGASIAGAARGGQAAGQGAAIV